MLTSIVFLETSIPNTPSITVLSFHFIFSARAPPRTTLYADVRFIARPPHRSVRAAFPHTAPTSGQ